MRLFLLTLCLIALASSGRAAPATEQAIFAGGCFWCMDAEFEGTPGVLSVVSGYTGGTAANPTYEQVSSGETGHREAVQVTYDPAKVSYEKLLHIYWGNIDPTDAGGQFYDRGTQYQTAIFYGNEQQHALAEASKRKAEAQLKSPVHTEILPATAFYPAEEHHQSYYKKNPEHFQSYEKGSGRESRLKEIWGDKEKP